MKKLIFILIFPLLLNSQMVSVGLDPSNALYGSDVNNPSLDIQLRFMSIEKWGEIGIQFENFNEIKYFSWGVFVNRSFYIKKVELLLGIEGFQILRKQERSTLGWFSYGLNAETRYWITKKFGISAQYNYRWRQDLKWLYNDGRFVDSGFINLIYKWK